MEVLHHLGLEVQTLFDLDLDGIISNGLAHNALVQVLLEPLVLVEPFVSVASCLHEA